MTYLTSLYRVSVCLNTITNCPIPGILQSQGHRLSIYASVEVDTPAPELEFLLRTEASI